LKSDGQDSSLSDEGEEANESESCGLDAFGAFCVGAAVVSDLVGFDVGDFVGGCVEMKTGLAVGLLVIA
jgi:hypothetical protein